MLTRMKVTATTSTAVRFSSAQVSVAVTGDKLESGWTVISAAIRVSGAPCR